MENIFSMETAVDDISDVMYEIYSRSGLGASRSGNINM